MRAGKYNRIHLDTLLVEIYCDTTEDNDIFDLDNDALAYLEQLTGYRGCGAVFIIILFAITVMVMRNNSNNHNKHAAEKASALELSRSA